MANTVGGSVVWDLDVDDKKLTSGLSNAEKQVASTAKNIDNASTGMASSIMGAFKKAEGASLAFATALGGIGVALIGAAGFAVKSASDMEMLRASLDTLTGSTEKGSALFKSLNEFANRTPFQTGDLAKAAQTMLGFGIATDKVIPNLQMLGDISLGNKEKLGGLALAFSQVSSTGRLTGQDLLQMINNGFNPLAIIAQKTGKSMATLKEEMANGAISADMVRDAMVSATSKGGLFFEGMKRGAATLEGVWSTFQDTVGLVARSLVGLSDTGQVLKGGLLDVLKNGLLDLNAFLTQNQGKIIKFFQDSFGWLQKNGPVIVGIIVGALTPAIVGFIGSVGLAVAALAPFIAIGAAIGLVIQNMGLSFGDFGNIATQFVSTIQTIASTMTSLLQPAWNAFMAGITAAGPEFDKLLQILGPLLLNALKVLGMAFVAALGVFTALVQGISTALPFIVQLLNGFVGIVGGIMSILVGIFTLNWKLIWEGIKTTVIAIKDIIVGVFGTIISFIAGFIKGFIDYFKNLYNVLVGNSIIPDMVNAIVAWIAKLPGMIYNVLSSLVSGMANLFKDAWNAVSSQVQSWISQATGWAQNIAKAFVDGFSQLGQWLKDKIASALAAAREFLEGQSPPVAGPFKDIDKWGFNVGTAWVDGVAAAVKTFSLPNISPMSLASLPTPSVSPMRDVALKDTGRGSNQNITVNVGTVKTMSDVDKISREIGFKLAVV